MEIIIQSGEGISQAIKRKLQSEEGVQNKQFNKDAWSMIQSKLNDGKSTLKHKQSEKLIGDLWKPVTKNVLTQVNDVITIDDDTWKEILGYFGGSKVEQQPAPTEQVVTQTPQPQTTKVPQSEEPKAIPQSELPVEEVQTVQTQIQIQQAQAQEPTEEIPSEAEVYPEIPAEEVVDIETVKQNEKSAIQIRGERLNHDATVLMSESTNALVDTANMEDKFDVESGREVDYEFQRIVVSNGRTIEIRTDNDGNRSVHVMHKNNRGYLNMFHSAEVVYDLNPDGESRMRIRYELGENDWEEEVNIGIKNEKFYETMNGIIKKMLCE